MYKAKEDVMHRVQEHYKIAQNMGYEIVGVFLQGSWNYGDGMSDEESDVDTKCLVLPKFEDFCLNKKPVSTTFVCENDEHIDIKDLRLYVECFRKQNVNFVEILFTDYRIINPKYQDVFQKLIDSREEIGRYNPYAALNCMAGMAYEKLKALEHPYPSIIDKIEKYGFDGKQLSHILRLQIFMQRWLAGESYEDCLIVPAGEVERIRRFKRNQNIALEEARRLAEANSNLMKEMKDLYMSRTENVIDRDVDQLFKEVVVECMKINFIDELIRGKDEYEKNNNDVRDECSDL